MSKVNDGGAAFPMLWNIGYNTDWDVEPGMSMRDYFAANALTGLISRTNPGSISRDDCNFFASQAYWMADAMLAARNAPTA